ASPTEPSTVAGDRPAQPVQSRASASRRSSPWRDIARRMNSPPRRKNTLGSANGASTVRVASNRPLASAGTAPSTTHRTTRPRPDHDTHHDRQQPGSGNGDGLGDPPDYRHQHDAGQPVRLGRQRASVDKEYPSRENQRAEAEPDAVKHGEVTGSGVRASRVLG